VYNHFYGFRENPFNQTPDSAFFYPSEKHKAALDAIMFAVKQYKGFVVITGEIGCGKTTVVRTLLNKMQGKLKTAMITNTHLSPKGVLTMILEDLGVEYREGAKDKLLLRLYDYLIQQAREGMNVVLIIDEAQNLNQTCLEEIRMLSNLETEKEKLVQIVLVGQPELRKKLELPNLEQLRQRISIHYHLTPLGERETKAYILHRLNVAKMNGVGYESLFNEEAYESIYRLSRGIPRMINHVCDHALLTGCLMEARIVTKEIVEETMSEICIRG